MLLLAHPAQYGCSLAVVQVKLWDVSTGQPSLITAQDLKVSNMY